MLVLAGPAPVADDDVRADGGVGIDASALVWLLVLRVVVLVAVAMSMVYSRTSGVGISVVVEGGKFF